MKYQNLYVVQKQKMIYNGGEKIDTGDNDYEDFQAESFFNI